MVLDEAHLIGNPRCGPTQELLLTSLLLQPSPPRLVLLSATLGDLKRARRWLAPCDLAQVSERYPPLRKEVLSTGEGETADALVQRWLGDVLTGPDTQALVFVYQTASAEKLARDLSSTLGPLAGAGGAVAYHSKLSSAQRETARDAFLDGRSRVVVTTSALAMGINLPATHVVVRDLTYRGASRAVGREAPTGLRTGVRRRARRWTMARRASTTSTARAAWSASHSVRPMPSRPDPSTRRGRRPHEPPAAHRQRGGCLGRAAGAGGLCARLPDHAPDRDQPVRPCAAAAAGSRPCTRSTTHSGRAPYSSTRRAA